MSSRRVSIEDERGITEDLDMLIEFIVDVVEETNDFNTVKDTHQIFIFTDTARR